MTLAKLIQEFQKMPGRTEEEICLISRAYEFAEKAHEGQKRKTNEPYFSHSYKTALQVVEWKMDAITIAAALLHDVAEDTSYGLPEIEKEFGTEVARLVEGVTKIGHLKYRTSKEAQAENLRKMILAICEDLRVVIIKLADRLHNMKTLGALPPQKQQRIALETFDIYSPLAYRLGMQNLAGELEDLAFPYLYPREYDWVIKNIQERYEDREKYLKKIKPIVEKALQEANIKPIKIDFRAKRYSSLYKKLVRYDMNVDMIYDLVAMRIIVNTVEECYTTLGIIHQLWPPISNRIKDYIALPKPNGYRSLHTTVLCLENKAVEIQIRTLEMHEESENGIAAHWAYEQSKGKKTYLRKNAIFADKKELAWVDQLRSWQKDFSDSDDFLSALKIDFFKDRIFAVTPKGEVIDLPQGATPIDFAYKIHSDVGNGCIGAKVNNKIVPLSYKLNSGDLVEIMTQKNKKPSKDWLDFAISESAKGHIKAALKSKKINLSAPKRLFKKK